MTSIVCYTILLTMDIILYIKSLVGTVIKKMPILRRHCHSWGSLFLSQPSLYQIDKT